MSEVPDANPADVQEQQQTPEGDIPPEGGPDLERLERDLGGEADEGDAIEQSQG